MTQVNFNFSKGMKKKGQKVSESSNPELYLTSSYSKFGLSNRAMELMGLRKGDHVTLFDMQEFCNGDQSKRFYIAKIDHEINGKQLGAVIGANNTFNFSGVYNSILVNDPERSETIQRDLMAEGLLVATKYKNGHTKYVATRKGFMPIEFYGEHTVDLEEVYEIEGAGEITLDIYSVGEPTFEAHKPQISGEIITNFADLSEEDVAAAEDVDRGEDTPEDDE